MKQRQFLKDYTPSLWQIPQIHLKFDIRDERVEVHARYQMQGEAGAELRLDGRQMELKSLKIDGQDVSSSDYQVDEDSLRLTPSSSEFVLETVVELDPWSNTSLEGLYHAGGILCTQCESHGFSRITYSLDRPDVMSVFEVEIEADAKRWPILLANGEQQSQELDDSGRQRVVWQDPHPKPCYLFALVAGDMAQRGREFVTSQGRKVKIGFFCDHGIEHKLEHAIDSLVRSMRWDEQVYGLAYDLDTYNVVVAGAFNMGAMENKGLNIFNPKYVLADAESATDADFAAVEAVIGHEYFHNWTGNRVTCRDWFQLSLKEGLTVFRDQQFSADCGAGPAQRIEQVQFLRARQFAEDAGPLSHPVRPDSYVEMNNFYTVTVYEKGAELVRLLHAREGVDGFRKGMDLYFQRHDGQAVTIEDFLAAHGDANQQDISKVLPWYGQAGTPLVEISDEYVDGVYRLHCRQSYPTNPNAQAVLIPIKLSLLGADGQVLVGEQVMELTEAEQTFEFVLAEAPTPVLFEEFSAPVNWHYDYDSEQLQRIAQHARDPFSRWEAVQRIYRRYIDAQYAGQASTLPAIFVDLLQRPANPAVLAALLTPPRADELLTQWPSVDPLRLCQAIDSLQSELAKQVAEHLEAHLQALNEQLSDDYRFDPEAAAARSLRARLLRLWAVADADAACSAAKRLYQQADNLTDRMAALSAINQCESSIRDELLAQFYEQYQSDKLVLDRWFSMQAQRAGSAGLANVRQLLEHADFEKTNPNRVRALLGSFGMNISALYAEGGLELLAKQLLVFDRINPQLAARLVVPFAARTSLSADVRERMDACLRSIQPEVTSADVKEQVDRILDARIA